MELSGNSGKQALIPIMNGQYERIRAIESAWGIRFAEGDMRPRIEHFHDAVRALTSGDVSPYESSGRLSVESLAYDLGQLRLIPSHPVGKYSSATDPSAGDALVEYGKPGMRAGGADRATRQELAQLYKDYTVLFAALFAEIADMNFKARGADVDSAVEDIARIEQVLAKLAKGEIKPQEAHAALDAVEQDDLRARIQYLLQQSQKRESDRVKAQQFLKNAETGLSAEKKRLEQAHMGYATGQLAVYEEAKETIKRLAAQGMNLAGKFVESAMQNAQRGRGVGF